VPHHRSSSAGGRARVAVGAAQRKDRSIHLFIRAPAAGLRAAMCSITVSTRLACNSDLSTPPLLRPAVARLVPAVDDAGKRNGNSDLHGTQAHLALTGVSAVPFAAGDMEARARYCQTKSNQGRKCRRAGLSGCQLTPLGQGCRMVMLEDVTAIEMTVQVEVIVDRGVNGGEFLEGLDVPELRHRALSSSERLM